MICPLREILQPLLKASTRVSVSESVGTIQSLVSIGLCVEAWEPGAVVVVSYSRPMSSSSVVSNKVEVTAEKRCSPDAGADAVEALLKLRPTPKTSAEPSPNVVPFINHSQQSLDTATAYVRQEMQQVRTDLVELLQAPDADRELGVRQRHAELRQLAHLIQQQKVAILRVASKIAALERR